MKKVEEKTMIKSLKLVFEPPDDIKGGIAMNYLSANILDVSVDELLCDTVLSVKHIYENEAQEIFKDCNDYEIRVLLDVLKATKGSMRNVKLFENKINESK